jgi:2-polyprenyl-3-methyl-5-hydroxy-6-metoxy-1,4-benzoquinol methylase
MDRMTKTIAAYDKNCVAFENKFMEYPPYIQRIREFINLLQPRMKVLDLGCGPGNVSRQLMLSGQEFIIQGIDLSEEMIKLARENAPSGEFSCQDIREISFNDHSFDVIILSFCIVHLTDMETILLLQKVSKYMRKEGKLYLSFMEGKKNGFERTGFSKNEIYFNYHSADSVEKLLKDNGLSIIKVTKQYYPENDGSITTDVFIFAEKL